MTDKGYLDLVADLERDKKKLAEHEAKWGGPRAGAGRKPLPAGKGNSLKSLSLGVRPSEKKRLMAEARAALVPVSTYLRIMLGLPKVPPAA